MHVLSHACDGLKGEPDYLMPDSQWFNKMQEPICEAHHKISEGQKNATEHQCDVYRFRQNFSFVLWIKCREKPCEFKQKWSFQGNTKVVFVQWKIFCLTWTEIFHFIFELCGLSEGRFIF